MSAFKNEKFLVPLGFAIIYLVWGATYLFVSYAVEEITPFLLSSLRYLGAAAILAGLVLVFKHYKDTTSSQVKNALFAGVLFIGVGSGGTAWVLQRLDSGFTALLIATQPLITVLMVWVLNKKRPNNESFLGLFLGLIGAYLLLSQNQIMTSVDQWSGVILVFVCLFTWAYGTIFVNKSDMPKSFLTNTGLQVFSGGLFSMMVSYAMGEPSTDWASVSVLAWSSLAILIVFGGVIVFVAFNYLLKKSTPEKVATNTYVNPVIALFLGWWFRDEIVSAQSVLAAALMLTGVVFINFEWKSITRFIGIKRRRRPLR